VFTGKKRMGAERAEEKGDIYLFIVYLNAFQICVHFFCAIIGVSYIKFPPKNGVTPKLPSEVAQCL